MSDEEVYFVDDSDDIVDDGDVNEGEEDSNQFCEEDTPNLEDQTPEEIYQTAKGNLNFQDELALKQFSTIVSMEDIEEKLKAKSTLQLTILCSFLSDIETTLNYFDETLNYVNKEILKSKHLNKLVNEVISKLYTSEDNLRKFLDTASEKIDVASYPTLSLDIKLKRIEIELKYANFSLAKKLVFNAEQNIPTSLDINDSEMCRSALKVLVYKIELAQNEHDQHQIETYYKKAISIKITNIPPRLSAVLKQVEGELLILNQKFQQAKQILFDSFKLFSDSGSKKSTEVLPFYVLATMATKDTIDIFLSKDISIYQNHPLVAPIRQLYQFYLNNDIVGYKIKKIEAQKTFFNKFYNNLIDNIESYVNMKSIAIFCQKYSSVKIQFIYESLLTEDEKINLNKLNENDKKLNFEKNLKIIKNQIIELIINNKLDAEIDNNTQIVTLKSKNDSLFLNPLNNLIQIMENNSLNLLKKKKFF